MKTYKIPQWAKNPILDEVAKNSLDIMKLNDFDFKLSAKQHDKVPSIALKLISKLKKFETLNEVIIFMDTKEFVRIVYYAIGTAYIEVQK